MSTAAASFSADAAPAAADNVTGRGGGGRRRNDQNIARNGNLLSFVYYHVLLCFHCFYSTLNLVLFY